MDGGAYETIISLGKAHACATSEVFVEVHRPREEEALQADSTWAAIEEISGHVAERLDSTRQHAGCSASPVSISRSS